VTAKWTESLSRLVASFANSPGADEKHL